MSAPEPVPLAPYNPGQAAAPAVTTMEVEDELTIKSFEGGEKLNGATWTYSENALGLTYKKRLHPLLKFLPFYSPWFMMSSGARAMRGCATCSCIFDFLYFEDRIHPRSYQAVYENRIEFNYPYHSCCGLCVDDHVIVKHFDRIHSIEEADKCTPYHCFCVLPCSGPVLAEAPCAEVNHWFLPCCRDHYPSVDEPAEFLKAHESASRAFSEGKRKVPKFFVPGPTPAAAAAAAGATAASVETAQASA